MNIHRYACTAFTLLLFCLPASVWAYLDPGSGSYAIQVLIGLAAGAIFVVRSTIATWFDRLRRFFVPTNPKTKAPKTRKRR
jgi:hypothetical protein